MSKIWYIKNPSIIGDYICRMNNAYIKMCHWNGIEWTDMWKNSLDGTVKEWMNIPYDKKEPIKDILDNIVKGNKDILLLKRRGNGNEMIAKELVKNTLSKIKTSKHLPIDKLLLSFMDENYGTNPVKRFEKLSEEFDEVMDAYGKFCVNSNEKTYEHLQDELCDLQAVLAHLLSIFNLTHQEAIVTAHKKCIIRQTNPMYKRESKN